MVSMKEQGYVRPKDDFYETPEVATYTLLNNINIPEDVTLWEPSCGWGAISKILERVHPNRVLSTELDENRYGIGGVDFLQDGYKYKPEGKFWVVTNPPFSLANSFVRKAFEYGAERVIFLLRFNYLGSTKVREDILEGGHLLRVLLIKERLQMYPYGWTGTKGGAKENHAWFIWDRNYHASVPSEIVVRRVSLKEGRYYKYVEGIE